MVRDVPRDGNYLFSTVTVQLDNLGVQPSEMTLREQLVEYIYRNMQAHMMVPPISVSIYIYIYIYISHCCQ